MAQCDILEYNSGFLYSSDGGSTWKEDLSTKGNGIAVVGNSDWLIENTGIIFASNSMLTGVGEKKLENQISRYFLFQNYPNPYNPSTLISYQIPSNSFVTLKVYDVLGNEIAVLVNEEKAAGAYKVNFTAQQTTNNKPLASGMYFYTLTAGKFTDTKKFILLK